MRLRVLVCFLFLACAIASAQPFVDLNSVTGVWSSATPVGTTGLVGVGTNEIRWGDVANVDLRSGYNFTGTAPPEQVNVNGGAFFALGTFTHYNFPIPAGTSITGAVLDITLQMTVPTNGLGGAANVVQAFSYNFDHFETPNGDNPCANGGANNVGVNINGCADRARILNTIPNAIFLIGDTQYTLQLGFSNDGGTTIVSDFWTVEQATNRATLYGKLTTEVVPEPGFYGALSLGLAGLYFAVRRRRSQA